VIGDMVWELEGDVKGLGLEGCAGEACDGDGGAEDGV
jgi:hypothetical protein